MKIDYSLYLVTDEDCINGTEGNKCIDEIAVDDALCHAVEQAILGGCTMVQLREKNISARDFYYRAEQVKKVTNRYHIPLIINDRIDIALAVKASGVHIGQRDIPAAVARKIIGPDMLLGVSAASVSEAVRAWKEGADYLGVGAVFPTRTKEDAKAVSIGELIAIRRAVPIPVVAIGGINKENAAGLMRLGIDGVAVISAILAQPDVRKAAEEIKDLL